MDDERYTDIDLTVVGVVSDEAFDDLAEIFAEWADKHGYSSLIAALHPYDPEEDEKAAPQTLNMARAKIERVRALADQYEAAPESVQYLIEPSFKSIVVKELREAIQ